MTIKFLTLYFFQRQSNSNIHNIRASTNACWNFGHVGAPSLGAILSNDVVAWPNMQAGPAGLTHLKIIKTVLHSTHLHLVTESSVNRNHYVRFSLIYWIHHFCHFVPKRHPELALKTGILMPKVAYNLPEFKIRPTDHIAIIHT